MVLAHSSGGESLPVPGIRIPDRIQAVLRLSPDDEALEFEGRWRPWSYLASGVETIDAALVRHSVGASRPVGVVMRNRPEIVRLVTAILATGRCVVTLSSVIPRGALIEEVSRLGLPAVGMSAGDWDGDIAATVSGAGGLALRVGDRPGDAVDEQRSPSIADGPSGPAGQWRGVAVQMLTSGTTGSPKRIDLQYRSLAHEIASTSAYSPSDDMTEVRLRPGTTILWAPLLHIGGLRGLITSLVAGRKVALLERFDVASWSDLVRRHRPRVVSLAPTAIRMVLDADVPTSLFEGVRAVVAGTAPVTPELADEFLQRYGIPVLVVYGATEFAGGVAGWTLPDWQQYGPQKRGSVGRPNPGVSVRITDPQTGDEVPVGESGLLQVRAPQLGGAGWVTTTDLARVDGDGFIWILGRADDVVIRGGFKVSTNVVRDCLLTHPAVGDASVVGVDDPRLGQVPVAAVERKANGPRPDAGELRVYLRSRLPAYQVPIRIIVVEQLPRTPSMKVSQPAVRELFETSNPRHEK